MTSRLPYLTFIFCLLISSCSFNQSSTLNQVQEDNSDLSCSYFYFLWGSHAEINGHYAEAFEAYEKALICDPYADYVKRKLPILLLKMGENEKAVEWLQQAIKEQPDTIPLYLFLANIFARQSNYTDAIKLYDKVLELDPDNEDVQLRLAFLYTYQEEYALAERILKKLLKKNEDNYFAHFYLARLLQKTKRYDESGPEYEKAITLNWSKDLAYEIAHFYTTRKQHEDALRLFSSITQEDPYDERAALSRIQSLLDLSRNDDALTDLEQIRSFSKNKSHIDLITAKILLRGKELVKAKELLLKLTNNNNNSEPHYLLGLILFQDGKYNSALDHLNLVETKSDIFEESVYLQTRVFKQLDEPTKSIKLLEKYILTPDKRRPLFYALLSSLYQEQKKIPEAIALLKAAILIYPENPQLFFEYGLLLERNGKYQQAIFNMEKVIELQPEHAEALNFIGYTWADNDINLNLALDYIKKAVELKPENGYIADSLGWVYFRLGRLEQAETALEYALKLEPKDPHIYDHLGDVYVSLKKNTKALQTYKKAYEMFTSEKKRTKVREKIDTIKKQLGK